MRSGNLTMACIGALALPGGVLAADCTAAAKVVIAKNLTANWRMLQVDVSSDSCETLACNGTVVINVRERLPKSSDVNSYQISLAYEIEKGSHATSFKSTRKFGSDMAEKPALETSVDTVSCFNR